MSLIKINYIVINCFPLVIHFCSSIQHDIVNQENIFLNQRVNYRLPKLVILLVNKRRFLNGQRGSFAS